ncbi:unnamed protein product [Clonostachys rosea]|uniref:F-box domain-containing protein n=1 Tax=Bionectria ochroleuca TaxID=29856 RepID=A0ABY6URR9_BIOOC|nr:unnamed protein product [Clonostachys rosea]
MTFALLEFPAEILDLIAQQLCPHCWGGPEDEVCFQTLLSLTSTCRALCAAAQPILYHMPFSDALRRGETRSVDGPNIALLARTLIESPRLANAVRDVGFRFAYPQHSHRLSDEEIVFFEQEMDNVFKEAGQEATRIRCNWTRTGTFYTPEGDYHCDSNEFLRMLLVAKTKRVVWLDCIGPGSVVRPKFELPNLTFLNVEDWQDGREWDMDCVSEILQAAPVLKYFSGMGICAATLEEGAVFNDNADDLMLISYAMPLNHFGNVMRGFPNLKKFFYRLGDYKERPEEAPSTQEIVDALWIRSDTLESIVVDMSLYQPSIKLNPGAILDLNKMEVLEYIEWSFPLCTHEWKRPIWTVHKTDPVEEGGGDVDHEDRQDGDVGEGE